MHFKSTKDIQFINCYIDGEVNYVIQRAFIPLIPYTKYKEHYQKRILYIPRYFRYYEKIFEFIESNEKQLDFYALLMKIYKIGFFYFHKRTFIDNQNILVYEWLMWYKKKTYKKLNDLLLKQKEFSVGKLLTMLINLLSQFESHCLLNINIKPTNIYLVSYEENNNEYFKHTMYPFDDESNSNVFLRDHNTPYFLDISTNPKMNINIIKEDNSIYAAPKIVCYYHVETESRRDYYKINFYKCQIFSIGVILLECLGFFNVKLNKHLFNKLKLSSTEYTYFLELVEEFYNEKNDAESKKIITFANFCLNYDAKKRPSSNEILLKMKPFENSTLEDIYNGIFKIKRNRLSEYKKKELHNFIYKKKNMKPLIY